MGLAAYGDSLEKEHLHTCIAALTASETQPRKKKYNKSNRSLTSGHKERREEVAAEAAQQIIFERLL